MVDRRDRQWSCADIRGCGSIKQFVV
jgi:hypothetical protein